jgi:hypothetical protein
MLCSMHSMNFCSEYECFESMALISIALYIYVWLCSVNMSPLKLSIVTTNNYIYSRKKTSFRFNLFSGVSQSDIFFLI